MRQKVVPTPSGSVTTSDTSSLPGGFARVSLITDEWLAVPLKGGEDKSPKNSPTGETPLRGKDNIPHSKILTAILLLTFIFCGC